MPKTDTITIAPPRFETAAFTIEGTAPYVQRKFSKKAQDAIRKDHEEGGTSRSRKKRDPKDYEAECWEALHTAEDGAAGIPAPAFRAAMISACRAAGVVMTRAKLSLFVEPDGFDPEDGTPLVLITKGSPRRHDAYGRDAHGGTQVMSRPMWDPGWQAVVRITFDADMVGLADVGNLLARAGLQVGIGEGRPDSKKSTGLGWGTFRIVGDEQEV